jgi:MFS family permease
VSSAAPEPSAAAPRLDAHQRVLATGLVLGVTLVAFESTSVITALPTITDDLGGDSLYGFTLAAYTLANMVALVAAGQMADRRGPRPTFVLAALTFIAGLVVSGFAPSMIVVVIGRLLQGAGAGGFAPIAYSLVKRAFPEQRQPMMYVYLSAGWVLPSLVAPAFGGLVTDAFGWRWVFFGIVPLAAVVGVVGSTPMRVYGPVETDGDDDPQRLLMAAAVAVGTGLFVLGLRAANPAIAVVSAAAGVAVGLPALRRLLPAGFFTARRGQPAVLTCRLLATATFMGVDGFIPLAADRIHGASPIVQGFTIIGAALTWTSGQAIVARREALPPATAVRIGFSLLFVSVGLVLPVLSNSWPLWATFLGWAVGGMGMGVLYNPTTVAAMSYAGEGREGTISSQVQLVDALGFSLMGGVGGAAVAYADRSGGDLRGALAASFGIAAACALTGVLVSRGVRRAG